MKEPKEYQAECMKIAGFSCMSPFGLFLIDLLGGLPEIDLTNILFNGIVSIVIFRIGLFFINRGYELLGGKYGSSLR